MNHITQWQGIMVGILLSAVIPTASHAAAKNFIYPLDSWQVSTKQGEEIGDNLYHMGVDAGGELEAGEAVYAIADGVVKEVKERSQFGLVILIEHTLTSGNKIVSLYGHLDPNDSRVSAGQRVDVGEVIGTLGDSSVNGGWPVHVHFGIHKQPYSDTWIYYGHVTDPATGADWHNPETYIPNHLTVDAWQPTVQWDMYTDQIVGDTVEFSIIAKDIGSGIESLVYKVSADGGVTWDTVAKTSAVYGETRITLPLYDYEDGELDIKVTARDAFNNKITLSEHVVKDPSRYTRRAFVATKAEQSDGFVTQWSFGGTNLDTAFYPIDSAWSGATDIAVGQFSGANSKRIVIGTGSRSERGKISIFTPQGKLRRTFTAFAERGPISIATADVTNDGYDEIIVGGNKRSHATVRVYSNKGELLFEFQPFTDIPYTAARVATGDVTGDGSADIIVATGGDTIARVAVVSGDGSIVYKRFKPFGKKNSSALRVAVGDTQNDGTNDIIVSNSSATGSSFGVFTKRGASLRSVIQPFGDSYTGEIDITAIQWDTVVDAEEIIVSQASDAQAWIKVYRLDTQEGIAYTKRIYEAVFQDGTNIAAW